MHDLILNSNWSFVFRSPSLASRIHGFIWTTLETYIIASPIVFALKRTNAFSNPKPYVDRPNWRSCGVSSGNVAKHSREVQRNAVTDKGRERHCVNDCTHTHTHTHGGFNERHWWGEKGGGGVHTKPESPVLVCPTRGSVVEVHWKKDKKREINHWNLLVQADSERN